MCAASRSRLCSGLVILAALLPSSGGVYVRRGSDITNCGMKCPHTDGVLQLYRKCGGNETHLLELWCENMWLYNRYQPRLLYNTSTGCWTLRDAGKNDSCVYNMVYDHKGNRSLTNLNITVQDPVLIYNSEDNREYQLENTDPAVSHGHVVWILSSVAVMATIIVLLVMYCRRKRTKTGDVERRSGENGERISSSQTDRPGEKNFLIRIRETWENIQNIQKTPEYEETPQRDELEMSAVPSGNVTP